MTGYKSKRAAAQDKLVDDRRAYYEKFDDLYAVYLNGVYDGKKAAAQEPTKYSFKAHWEEDGCIGVVAAIERLDGGVHLLKDTIDAPQPAQEPVAYLCKPDQHGLFNPPTPNKACKECFPVYAAPPQPAQEPWRESASDYERGVIDGRQMQAQSSVDKAVNAMTQRPWVGLTDDEIAEFGTWHDNREEEVGWVSPLEVVAYIDDKLKERNHG